MSFSPTLTWLHLCLEPESGSINVYLKEFHRIPKLKQLGLYDVFSQFSDVSKISTTLKTLEGLDDIALMCFSTYCLNFLGG
jgi:hypothetical protein